MTINPDKKKSLSANNQRQPKSLSLSKTKAQTDNDEPSTPMTTATKKTQKTPQAPWWLAWQLWAIMLVIVSGGIGYGATAILLKLPKTQSCDKVFWPIASASVRIYCAQVEADKDNVAGLLKAIATVDVLPENHPLRAEINRNVEKWATSILDIAEEEFQEGDLDKAIAIAQQIPADVPAYNLVEAKIGSWQGIWSDAEETYAQVQEQLRQANWNQAFVWAVRLTESKNQFWATTKYQNTIDEISIAQEETTVVDTAYSKLRKGGIDNLLEAIDKAGAIESESYAYQNAQDLVAEAKDQLIRKVENLIEQQKWQKLLQITYRIPPNLKLQQKVKDWKIIANAGSSASLGTVYSLEDAIAEAKNLPANSPYYPKLQKLVSRWELEIDDVTHLAEAEQLALGDTIKDYNQAIAVANRIPAKNPRYREAQQKIADWQDKIQIIEDRPILERAQQIAVGGNIRAWERAIAEASLISSTSPLGGEAQRYITTWRVNIERQEDSPILEQAAALADARDYAEAIAIAQKIRPQRALYREAQQQISLWQQELQGREYLQQAFASANQETPLALAKAIRIARQVGRGTSLYNQAVQNINHWSAQILALAQTQANTSPAAAIEIAQLVPLGTASYSQAQAQIQTWRDRLRPLLLNFPDKPPKETRLNQPDNKN